MKRSGGSDELLQECLECQRSGCDNCDHPKKLVVWLHGNPVTNWDYYGELRKAALKGRMSPDVAIRNLHELMAAFGGLSRKAVVGGVSNYLLRLGGKVRNPKSASGPLYFNSWNDAAYFAGAMGLKGDIKIVQAKTS